MARMADGSRARARAASRSAMSPRRSAGGSRRARPSARTRTADRSSASTPRPGPAGGAGPRLPARPERLVADEEHGIRRRVGRNPPRGLHLEAQGEQDAKQLHRGRGLAGHADGGAASPSAGRLARQQHALHRPGHGDAEGERATLRAEVRGDRPATGAPRRPRRTARPGRGRAAPVAIPGRSGRWAKNGSQFRYGMRPIAACASSRPGPRCTARPAPPAPCPRPGSCGGSARGRGRPDSRPGPCGRSSLPRGCR